MWWHHCNHVTCDDIVGLHVTYDDIIATTLHVMTSLACTLHVMTPLRPHYMWWHHWFASFIDTTLQVMISLVCTFYCSHVTWDDIIGLHVLLLCIMYITNLYFLSFISIGCHAGTVRDRQHLIQSQVGERRRTVFYIVYWVILLRRTDNDTSVRNISSDILF